MKRSALYDDFFYEAQIKESYLAAKIYVKVLKKIYRPSSVVDLGCGRGAWLKAFYESGAKNLVGFDGPWNNQESMIIQQIKFRPINLNKPLKKDDGHFDLAISVEVAEHLPEASANTFINNLTMLSDNIIFGAAYPGQGGVDHINEKPQSYWAKLFTKNNYYPFDIFRPQIWGNTETPFWYQQNTFLYVKKNSALYKILEANKITPIINLAFMDCIHPEMFEMQNKIAFMLKSRIKKITPKFLIDLIKRLK